jgi:hypothetical protein
LVGEGVWVGELGHPAAAAYPSAMARPVARVAAPRRHAPLELIDDVGAQAVALMQHAHL